MADVLTKEQRQYCMSRIRSKNTKIEMIIFKLLKDRKIKFRRHYDLPGKPDIAIPGLKLAIFINSDFWHGWRFSTWGERLNKNIGGIKYCQILSGTGKIITH
jgi:DNA mismatch endonuclease, patch repair protein